MAEQYFINVAEAIEKSQEKMEKAKNLYDFENEEEFIKEVILSLRDESENILEYLIRDVELYLYIYIDSNLKKVPKTIGEERERDLEKLDIKQGRYNEWHKPIDNLVDWLKKA